MEGRGLCSAIKSGFTNRNHSHLDAGTLLFGWGDEWLIDAPGYGRVGPGFWDRGGPRWEYYSNATESHSTLLIHGKNQRFDAAARGTITAFESTPETCRLDIDLTGAYEDVLRVRRQVFHRRGQYILVLDEIAFLSDSAKDRPVEWLLQPGKTVTLTGSGTSSVILQGKAGPLRVQALASPETAAPVFLPRKPHAQHRDIPPEAIRTLALTAAPGTPVVTFAVLLVPGSSPDIKARIDSERPVSSCVVVEGQEFQDRHELPAV